MIAAKTLDQLYQRLDIVEVIGSYLELKKSGASYKARSPFTQEKSASFMVSPTKQIYKCFSSGHGGNAVDFVMKHKSLSFPEAVNELCKKYSIEVLYEGKEEIPEQKNYKESLTNVLRSAVRLFCKELETATAAQQYLQGRKITEESIMTWQIGYAPGNKAITHKVIDKGLYNEAKDLGLVNTKDGQNRDVLWNRIVFPIRDHTGQLVGYGARILGDGQPKYLNSPESPIYKKERVLYGLWQAAKHIRSLGYAILVEGYTDVIAMHQADACNTIAACGTAFGASQARLLKRYTDHVVIMADGDDAGQKSVFRTLPILLEQGFKVDVFELTNGQDPYDFAISQQSDAAPETSEQPQGVGQ